MRRIRDPTRDLYDRDGIYNGIMYVLDPARLRVYRQRLYREFRVNYGDSSLIKATTFSRLALVVRQFLK